MKIIVTNDDGIDAPGIETLAGILDTLGTTVVAAPAEPQSGMSHRVTTDTPIRVEELTADRIRIFGTPVDCSRVALTQLAPDADFLVAGINRGGNLGADIYISGTVAAAREAMLLGYHAIAVSHYVAKNREVDWHLAGRRISPILKQLMTSPVDARGFWNVNLPHPETTDPDLEMVFCPLDPNPLGVSYTRNGGHFIYNGNYHQRSRQPGCDVDVCFGGKIAVTRIPLDFSTPVI